MSRHEFTDDAGATWSVGWNEPMVTYFAQREVDDGGRRELEDVAGTSIGEVTTFDGFLEVLRDHVEPPDEIHDALRRDQPQFTAAPIATAIARQDQFFAQMRDAASARPAPGVAR